MSQDFSQRNLRQQSFAEQDLTGADFTGADIRGTDFSKACLVHANFSQARAGLPPQTIARLLAFAAFLALLSGFITAYAGAVFGHLFAASDPGSLVLGSFIAIVLLLFGFTTLRNGLGAALGLVSLAAATAIVAIVAITPSIEIAGQTAISTLALGGAIAGVVGLALAMCLSRSRKLSLAIALLGILVGTLLGVSEEETLPSLIGVILLSANVLSLATYLGRQALLDDPRYRLIHHLTIHLSTVGGTRFCNADLTDANFTGASLSSTDFRTANLTRTCWRQAQLDRSNLERTYLEHSRIRQLLTAPVGNGVGQTFDRLDLRGVNLQGAKLTDASLIGTDLSNANLQGADLSRAKLVQAQVYGANLTGACLTGAYIQNWGIAPATKLDGIRCDYIYMHLPTKDDPDPYRKPDNRKENFQPGDFADFIAPMMRTLDLYHRQDIDPRKLADSFKTLDLLHHEPINPSVAALTVQQLVEQYPKAQIEIVALEGKSREKIRLQARVAEAADRSALSQAYFEIYNRIRDLPSQDIESLRLSENDYIHRLERLLENALNQPKFYVETYQNRGEFIMTQDKGNINIGDVQGNISGLAAAGDAQSMTGVAMGAIKGTVTNAINQLPDASSSEQPGIKELLIQLKTAIETEPELPDEDKVEALEQVKALAEAAQNPQEGTLKKTAKTAMKILKGTVASLPSAASLIEACAKLLPMLAQLLGI